MNIELLEYCLKGLRKRWKEVLRTSVVIFIAFTFVAGTLIFQSNMYKWQIQSAKSRFGSWYVMYEGSVKAENNDLKNHPYLGTAGLAQVNNYVYNSVGKTDISIGTLSDRFIEIGNIKLNKGRMPAKDNEIAVEWSTLIKLEQGSDTNIERKWYVVDAADYTLGRLASQVAAVLRGKNKPTYTPFLDCGDNVIVINAEKIKVTGKKLDQKIYYNHSDYVGGMKETTLKEMMEKHPERVIELAVKGMLPKGPLGRQMYTKLHVYAGPDHEQAAQKPEVLKF